MAQKPGRDTTPPPAALIVVADASEAARIRAYLAGHGMEAVAVSHGEAAVNVLDAAPVDLLVTELRAARIAGLALLALARRRNPELGAILLIIPGEEETATEALARGAVDFQTRPLNYAKLLASALQVVERQRLREQLAEARRRIDERYGFAAILGGSGAMARVRAYLMEIAPLDVGVLIVGEPGTGKDLVAAAVHQNSARRNGPFVTVHCQAFGGRLLSRELFGGTGRREYGRRRGRVELAAEGTLYLDEIGAMSCETQSRLAGLLRTGQLRPSLEEKPIEVSVRVIASSSEDPEGPLDAGRLDEGFLALVSAARVELPPLRHRRRDVPLLARHFLDEHAAREGRALRFERAALDRLSRYAWPGNVRELSAVIDEVAAHLGARTTVRDEDLPVEVREAVDQTDGLHAPVGTPLAVMERQLINATLQFCGGNREKAAKMLGMGVRTLYRKLREYQAE